jgi:hypothetical protein
LPIETGNTGRSSSVNFAASSDNGLPLLPYSDLMRAPGAENLSDAELELCTLVPLLPTHYVAAKDVIVR